MPRLMRAPALLAGLSAACAVSCTDVPIPSDLNEEGPPRVITVTVPSEGAGAELATYCAPEDDGEKLHPVCPGEGKVTDTRPMSWHVRVVFNERLIPSTVEELVYDSDGRVVAGSLENTQPLFLECGGEHVPYDGYYSPSGSHLTAAPGPALIVQPLEFVATSTQDCQITMKDVLMDWDYQRITRRGPYEFGIAAMRLVSASPSSCARGVALQPELELDFNAPVDAASLSEAVALVALDPEEPVAEEPVAVDFALRPSGETVVVTPVTELAADTTYALRVSSGIRDIKGGLLTMDEPLDIFFSTGAAISAEPCN